jgi:hypothetical protein
VLRLEFVLDPRGFVPSLHVHPHQEERFQILDGAARMRIGGVERDLTAGERVVVPAGVPHVWWNAEDRPVRLLVEFRPALRMREFFETLFAWVNEGKARPGIVKNPLRQAVFATEYRNEMQYPPQKAIPISRLPSPVLNLLLACLTAVGRVLGLRATPPGRR